MDKEICHVVSKGETLWSIVESELSAQGVDVNSYDTRNVMDQAIVERQNDGTLSIGDVVRFSKTLHK